MKKILAILTALVITSAALFAGDFYNGDIQFHGGLVYPRSARHQADGIVELRVKREHVQLDILTIDILMRIQHVGDELAVGSSGGMHADDALRFFLTLLIRGLLFSFFLIPI